MRAGFIQLERWGVLPLCRACGGRPVHPVRAGGVLKAGLLYRQDWSKPWSHQQPDPATLGLCPSRGWELPDPGGTETAELLKVVSGPCATIPFAALGDSSHPAIRSFGRSLPTCVWFTCLNTPALLLTQWRTSRRSQGG